MRARKTAMPADARPENLKKEGMLVVNKEGQLRILKWKSGDSEG